MFELFRNKPILNQDTRDWMFESYKWLLYNFGGEYFWEKTDLILPNNHFFPDKSDNPEKMALQIFNRVKEYACMDEWQCKLVAQENDPEIKVAPTILIQDAPRNPAGTFGPAEDSNEVIITYNPAHVENPLTLVSTFAHELSHYLTSTASHDPPYGWEHWEELTDLTSVFIGFGIFLANNAFNFQQYTDIDSQGWKTESYGYLKESELVFALAISLDLKEIDHQIAFSHIKPSLRKLLKKALKEIKTYKDEMSSLRKITEISKRLT